MTRTIPLSFKVPEVLQAPKEFAILHELVCNTYESVMAQRELIAYGFMAETGLRPSEIEQVQRLNIDGTLSWYLRKKGKED